MNHREDDLHGVLEVSNFKRAFSFYVLTYQNRCLSRQKLRHFFQKLKNEKNRIGLSLTHFSSLLPLYLPTPTVAIIALSRATTQDRNYFRNIMKKVASKSRYSLRVSKNSTFRSPLRKRQKRMTRKGKEALGLETPPSARKTNIATAKKKKNQIKPRKNLEHDESKEDSSLDVSGLACCICRCTVDFSDRDFFNWPDHDTYDILSTSSSESEKFNDENDNNRGDDNHINRSANADTTISQNQANGSRSIDDNGDDDDSSQGSQFYGVKFPTSFHDSNNALLICDGCDRCFHQRCHFLPVLSIPRLDWYCLICQYQEQLKHESKGSQKKTRHAVDLKIEDVDAADKPPTIEELDRIYRIPYETGSSFQKSDCKSESGGITPHERFEFHSSKLKSEMLTKETKKQLKAVINHQISSIRMCQASIRTFIGGARSRKALIEQYTTTMKLPQEFAESVARLAQCKMKIREMLQSLQNVIWNKNDRLLLLEWIETLQFDHRESINKTDFSMESVVTPPESISLPDIMEGSEFTSLLGVPITKDILYSKLFVDDSVRSEPRFDIKDYDADEDDEDDNSEGISKIKCSVCFSDITVEDENDILLCDGRGCFRSVHMKCCIPHVTQKMLDDDENGVWFCPLCVLFANALHYTQNEFQATDTDVFDYGDDNENDSVSSWENADDAFPEAMEHFAVASKWKDGKRDSRSDCILSSILGIEITTTTKKEDDKSDVVDELDDDDSEDDDFSEGEKSTSNSIDSNDSESASGGEWVVEQSELSNLSGQESDDTAEDNHHDDHNKVNHKARRSRRLEKEKKFRDAINSGKMDTANIIYGKRKRPYVDYSALNEILFSSVDSQNTNGIDDEEDYNVVASSDLHRSSSSESSSGSNGEISDDDDVGSVN